VDNIVPSFRVDISWLLVSFLYYGTGLGLLEMMRSPLVKDQAVARDGFFCFFGMIVDVVEAVDRVCIDYLAVTIIFEREDVFRSLSKSI
jgi:hypothetical protein